MGKEKRKTNEDKREYLSLAIAIGVIIVCVMMVARLGYMARVYLVVSFIFGEYTTLLLVLSIVYCVCNLILNRVINIRHIYFLGGVFIYLSVSMFCHLSLYSVLDMSSSTILKKTLYLYKDYLLYYDSEYTVGGGIIGGVLSQLAGLIGGYSSILIVGIALFVLGLSYFFNFNVFSLLKGGKLKGRIRSLSSKITGYFKTLEVPKRKMRVSISDLSDLEMSSSCNMQEGLNEELSKRLVEFIGQNKIACIIESYSTSYQASRISLKVIDRGAGLDLISGFFEKRCFFIEDNLRVLCEFDNQFKTLLTLKSLLCRKEGRDIPIFEEVGGDIVYLNYKKAKPLIVIADMGCGLKTFIRHILTSLLIEGFKTSDIWLYDLFNEFSNVEYTSINYINNIKSAGIAFDEAFSEYERRMDTIRYYNCDSIDEVNRRLRSDNREELRCIVHLMVINHNQMDNEAYQRLSYVIKFSLRVGVMIILLLRDGMVIKRLGVFEYNLLSFHLSNVSLSMSLFNTDIASRLQKKGDVVYQEGGRLLHGQAPFISKDDFNSIISKL